MTSKRVQVIIRAPMRRSVLHACALTTTVHPAGRRRVVCSSGGALWQPYLCRRTRVRRAPSASPATDGRLRNFVTPRLSSLSQAGFLLLRHLAQQRRLPRPYWNPRCPPVSYRRGGRGGPSRDWQLRGSRCRLRCDAGTSQTALTPVTDNHCFIDGKCVPDGEAAPYYERYNSDRWATPPTHPPLLAPTRYCHKADDRAGCCSRSAACARNATSLRLPTPGHSREATFTTATSPRTLMAEEAPLKRTKAA